MSEDLSNAVFATCVDVDEDGNKTKATHVTPLKIDLGETSLRTIKEMHVDANGNLILRAGDMDGSDQYVLIPFRVWPTLLNLIALAAKHKQKEWL